MDVADDTQSGKLYCRHDAIMRFIFPTSDKLINETLTLVKQSSL